MIDSTFALGEDFPAVSYDDWRAVVEKDLGGAPFEKKLVRQTYEGIALQPVYHEGSFDHRGDPAGFPGLPRHTRGSTALGGVLSGWDIRQEHAHPDIDHTNEAILRDLQRGVTSVLLRLDVAARSGIDADAAHAAQLAGRDGVMAYTSADLTRVLEGVLFDAAGVALEAGAAAPAAAAALVSTWGRAGYRPEQVSGAFNYDPLAVLARDGHLPTSLDRALAVLGDLAAFTSRTYPRVTAVRVGTAPYHHSGADAAQDIGFSMATAAVYLRAMTRAGLSVDEASRQLLFNFAVGCNFFLATAKLRAARRLFSRVIEASGGSEPARRMRLHVRTSRRVITSRDPWVNILRNTVCAFSGAIAGAESITTYPFDAAIGLPDDFSRRIARNTQIILQEESRLARVLDPSGGCWAIESMTEELAEKGWAIFQEIERQGGMSSALKSGWVIERIESAFAPRAANIARRKDALTGVSEFPNLREKRPRPTPPDLETLHRAAASRLETDRASSPPLDLPGPGSGELTEALVRAASVGASIGQMSAAVRGGEAGATATPIHPHPYAEPFEALRDAADAFEERTGGRPAVFLCNIGPVAVHTARASFAQNFFEAGGFEVQTNKGFGSPEEAADAFAASRAEIAVLCSSDEVYAESGVEYARALHGAGARTVVMAGNPGSREPEYRSGGVDQFIFIKCDVLGTLRALLREEGVLS